MSVEVIDNHSVRTDLLSVGGYVLDAGSRGFRFAKRMIELKQFVVSMDPDPEVENPDLERLLHIQAGLVGSCYHDDRATLHLLDDREARHLGTFSRYIRSDGTQVPTLEVRVQPIESIMKLAELKFWDCVKLNIEGSEYGVLEFWPGPIAKQIVVSFHEHTAAQRGDKKISEIVDNLARWYVPVRHVKDARYCAGMNYWDSLFVLKELVNE